VLLDKWQQSKLRRQQTPDQPEMLPV